MEKGAVSNARAEARSQRSSSTWHAVGARGRGAPSPPASRGSHPRGEMDLPPCRALGEREPLFLSLPGGKVHEAGEKTLVSRTWPRIRKWECDGHSISGSGETWHRTGWVAPQCALGRGPEGSMLTRQTAQVRLASVLALVCAACTGQIGEGQ